MLQMKQTMNKKRCEDHLNYLICQKRLEGLKQGGRVTTAQSMTTKRLQITVEQQLCWHTTIDDVMAEQVWLNLPAEEFSKVKEHFFGNLDE
jgi:hypothetical protein